MIADAKASLPLHPPLAPYPCRAHAAQDCHGHRVRLLGRISAPAGPPPPPSCLPLGDVLGFWGQGLGAVGTYVWRLGPPGLAGAAPAASRDRGGGGVPADAPAGSAGPPGGPASSTAPVDPLVGGGAPLRQGGTRPRRTLAQLRPAPLVASADVPFRGRKGAPGGGVPPGDEDGYCPPVSCMT